MSTRPEALDIGDDELFAFLLDDALEPARVEAIRAALVRSPALAARLATVSDGWERAIAAPERDDLYEARMWRRVAASLAPAVEPDHTVGGAEAPTHFAKGIGASAPPAARWRAGRLALAATILVTLGVGFLAGRIGREPPAAPTLASAPVLAPDASQRVLALHLADYFDAAERALLVAANSPGEGETAQALARELIDGNRVYAAAAERAGRPQLADFLRQLEPVLLELANGGTPDGLVAEQIRERDLAFKSRAAAALARRELAPPSRISL